MSFYFTTNCSGPKSLDETVLEKNKTVNRIKAPFTPEDADYDTIRTKGKSRSFFDTPVLQSFLVKSNLLINLSNLVDSLSLHNSSSRSGTIIALKYNDIIKGQDDIFKTKVGFKNACHLIMHYTLFNKRVKKMVHIKVTSIGTFQIIGVSAIDVERIIYKIFLIFEKINKYQKIYTYKPTIKNNENQTKFETEIAHNRLEVVIVPVLNNYILKLNPKLINKIFQNPKVKIIQKFIDSKLVSFILPNDPAITIKKVFSYEEFSNHPVKYIVWNKKYGKSIQYIEYDSYTTLLSDHQKINAQSKKYLTLRLYTTGKVLVSGFNKILIKDTIEQFLSICDQF